MSTTREIGCGDRVRRDGEQVIYVVIRVDDALGLAYLRAEASGRVDCAWVSQLRGVSG